MGYFAIRQVLLSWPPRVPARACIVHIIGIVDTTRRTLKAAPAIPARRHFGVPSVYYIYILLYPGTLNTNYSRLRLEPCSFLKRVVNCAFLLIVAVINMKFVIGTRIETMDETRRRNKYPCSIDGVATLPCKISI